MKIGISGWRLGSMRLGVARYTEYLIKEWSKMMSPPDELVVFMHSQTNDEWPDARVPVTKKILPPRMTNALWENLWLPWQSGNIDVLFGPTYTLPLFYPGKSVVSIHSVDEAVEGIYSLKYYLTYRQKYRLSCKKADIVVTNAQSTKDRIVSEYGISEEKIRVIWLGVDEKFRCLDDEEMNTQTRIKYFGKDVPYILLVGGLSKRRNIPALMESFSIVRKRENLPHHLFLVGPNRAGTDLESLAIKFGITDCFKQIDGNISSHDELIPIYNAADMYILPSFTEGFSLTLAEAMACGLPVVTSNKSSLGEVANGYGVTLEHPDSIEELAHAISSVLTDDEFKSQLKQKSLERASTLRWSSTARQTLDVIREVHER